MPRRRKATHPLAHEGGLFGRGTADGEWTRGVDAHDPPAGQRCVERLRDNGQVGKFGHDARL